MDKECGPYHRYVIGPDLVGLFVQSGGALGIITKAALRFFKYSSAHRFSGWGFRRADINKVAECGRELVLRRIVSDLHMNDWWAVYGWLPGASNVSKENWFFFPIAMWPKVYAIDEALKIKYGLWNDRYAPHLDSFFGILHRPTVKYETFVYGNPYDSEDKSRVNGWIHEFADAMADFGISWHHENYGPWLGPAWEKFLGNMGDTLKLFKALKKVFDPNGILGNPGIFNLEEVRRLGAEPT